MIMHKHYIKTENHTYQLFFTFLNIYSLKMKFIRLKLIIFLRNFIEQLKQIFILLPV